MSNVAAEDNHPHHHHHHHFHHQPTVAVSSLPPATDNAGESPRPVGDALEQHCRLVEGTKI